MKRQRVELVQSGQAGRTVFGWLCTCGDVGGPYADPANAADLADEHERQHARRRSLLIERFGPVCR